MKSLLIGICVLLALQNSLLCAVAKGFRLEGVCFVRRKIQHPTARCTYHRGASRRRGFADSVTYIVNVQLGQEAWSVAYFDEPSEPANAEAIKKLFDRTRKYRERSEYHHLVSEKEREVSGYPPATSRFVLITTRRG
jgi:hypothetical protein